MNAFTRGCFSVLFLLLCCGNNVLSAQEANPHIVLKITNVYLDGDRLDFDIEANAVTAEKQYLGFSDLVMRFAGGALSDTSQLWIWPGSAQLLSGEYQRLGLYEQLCILRLEKRDGYDYVYIGLDPPRFRDLQQFVGLIPHLDQRAGLQRIGRFTLTGVSQVPDKINLFEANRGMRTQVYRFLPKADFKAELAEISCIGADLIEQELEFFEATLKDKQVGLRWKKGELANWKSLSVERSYDLTTWEELAFTPVTTTSLTDLPVPPVYLEGKPLVYYRLQIQPKRGPVFYSSIRLVEVSN